MDQRRAHQPGGVARLGWSIDDAISRSAWASFGPVGARMGDSSCHPVGTYPQTVT